MNKKNIQIDTLGLAHFCIKNKNPIDVLRQNYIISSFSDQQIVNKIDWEFIYKGDEKSKNFILLTDLNDWSYILWNFWGFQGNIDLTNELSKLLDTRVNYYFVDSNIATSRWVFANKGQTTRAYYKSHDQKLFDIGFSEVEAELRTSIKETFVEDFFWDLYEKTCVSLEYVNRQKIDELKIYTSTLGNRKNKN